MTKLLSGLMLVSHDKTTAGRGGSTTCVILLKNAVRFTALLPPVWRSTQGQKKRLRCAMKRNKRDRRVTSQRTASRDLGPKVYDNEDLSRKAKADGKTGRTPEETQTGLTREARGPSCAGTPSTPTACANDSPVPGHDLPDLFTLDSARLKAAIAWDY
ncbi:MAG: hypothetical protein ACLTXH_06855 [Enterobacter hormaechei]